jgi:hypothetical protein
MLKDMQRAGYTNIEVMQIRQRPLLRFGLWRRYKLIRVFRSTLNFSISWVAYLKKIVTPVKTLICKALSRYGRAMKVVIYAEK